ncbi:nitroreductase family protein [Desulfocurvus sp. DL9XJH121]
MSVKQAIYARHSVRSYSGEPLTDEEVRELLEAAQSAPSSLNSQPWRFKVVRDRAETAWFGTREASRNQAWLAQAGAVFVCCADLEHYVKDSQSAAFFFREKGLLEGEALAGIESYVAREARADAAARFGACAMNVGIAVSFMMLRAVEMGLGACWIGMFDEAEIRARCALPEGLRVVCLLAVGRPGPGDAHRRRRKPLAEIVLD